MLVVSTDFFSGKILNTCGFSLSKDMDRKLGWARDSRISCSRDREQSGRGDRQFRRRKRREPWVAIFGRDGLANMYFWIKICPLKPPKRHCDHVAIGRTYHKANPNRRRPFTPTPQLSQDFQTKAFQEEKAIVSRTKLVRAESPGTASDCWWVYAWKKGEISCRQLQGLHRVRRSQWRDSFLAYRPACAHTKAW